MPDLDLAIRDATLITESGAMLADIGVSGETIALVAQPGGLPGAREAIDAAGLWLLPGAIDIQFQAGPDPGDFAAETRAAAAGGVTSVFVTPPAQPDSTPLENFRNHRARAEAQSIVDVAVYGSPASLNVANVLGLAAESAIGFALGMHRPGDSTGDGNSLIEDDQIHQALRLTLDAGKRLVAQCEDNAMLEAGLARMTAFGRADPLAHPESRPSVAEAVAVARLLALAEDLRAPVHVARVTCVQALDLIRSAQRRGVDVTAGTCPHYLLFDEADYARVGRFAWTNPPIRSAADQKKLWGSLLNTTLSVVCSGHASPRPDEGKNLPAQSGFPSVQTMLPAMLSAAQQGKCKPRDVVKWLCTEPARLFGLLGKKGELRPGADADMVLYDPGDRWIYSRDRMLSAAADCDRLYLDMRFQGQICATYRRGELIYSAGEVLARAGSGRVVRAN